MIRRTLLLAVFVLFGSIVLVAQERCYETQRAKGIQLYNQGDYTAAYKNFQTAKLCTDLPSDNDLDEWLDKCTIYVKLSPKKLTFSSSSNDRQSVGVSTNAKSFKVTGEVPSWCTVNHDSKTLYVDCNDNFSVSPRSARIMVTAGGKSAVFELVQEGANLEVSIKPETLAFSSGEESKTVEVSTNASEWSIGAYPDWVSVFKENNALNVKSFPNVLPQSRQGVVMVSVADHQYPVSISQLPGDTLIEIGEKELVFPNYSSFAVVAVESNMPHWQAEPCEEWIQTSVIGDSLKVFVNDNSSLISRHGQIRVSVGDRFALLMVHQQPFVSTPAKLVSELQSVGEAKEEAITVSSFPSKLKVYVDDDSVRFTPFTYPVDYEHHSLSVGFERREFFFNDNQQDIVFEPGIRFATITMAPHTGWGLMSGFVGSNSFGAFAHFQMTMPLEYDFVGDGEDLSGYNMTFGAVYQPKQFPYVGAYAGLGLGAYSPKPHIGLDYEAGIMGLYSNVILSMGFHRSRMNSTNNHTSFVVGVGGYLKRYYDPKYGYCASDSRRWWSVNYVWRPATSAKGVMCSDLGKEKVRGYVKALYANGVDSTSVARDVDLSFGVVFTPVSGIIDLCAGIGTDIAFQEENKEFKGVGFQGMGAELGVILNIWRFPITVMLHESDLFNDRKMYVDFGIGFHFGEFNKCSYK